MPANTLIHREVVITGVGLVSCLGEGESVHGAALAPEPCLAETRDWAPYAFFPLARVNFDTQIPKRGDQRQMSLGQRIGTYAAGLALNSAGIAGRPDMLAGVDIISTTAGGERDLAVDNNVLTGILTATDPGAFLNEQLMSNLRPTFFLGQLPNLLAGNIAIVHGITGSARTLLGEEAAGVDAVRLAAAQIASGQSSIVLVGGACDGTRKDLLLYLVAAGDALTGNVRPVFERSQQGGGVVLGSMGAFLVCESLDHARERGARMIARLARVVATAAPHADRSARVSELENLWSALVPDLRPETMAVISGASGAQSAMSIEREFLRKRSGLPIRAPGSHLGHGVQAHFPMSVGMAALMLKQCALYRASGDFEQDMPEGAVLDQILVIGVGRNYGEGLALVEAIGDSP